MYFDTGMEACNGDRCSNCICSKRNLANTLAFEEWRDEHKYKGSDCLLRFMYKNRNEKLYNYILKNKITNFPCSYAEESFKHFKAFDRILSDRNALEME